MNFAPVVTWVHCCFADVGCNRSDRSVPHFFKPTPTCPCLHLPSATLRKNKQRACIVLPVFFFSRFVIHQAINSLRGLLGEYRGDSGDGTRSPSQEAAASSGRGDGAKYEGTGGGEAATTAADGELARVAQGRLEWLTQRLRAHLSSELAAALRQADPLAAAGGKGTGTGNGTGGGGGGEGASEADEERRREGLARVKVTQGSGGAIDRTYPLCCVCVPERARSLVRCEGGRGVGVVLLFAPALICCSQTCSERDPLSRKLTGSRKASPRARTHPIRTTSSHTHTTEYFLISSRRQPPVSLCCNSADRHGPTHRLQLVAAS